MSCGMYEPRYEPVGLYESKRNFILPNMNNPLSSMKLLATATAVFYGLAVVLYLKNNEANLSMEAQRLANQLLYIQLAVFALVLLNNKYRITKQKFPVIAFLLLSFIIFDIVITCKLREETKGLDTINNLVSFKGVCNVMLLYVVLARK